MISSLTDWMFLLSGVFFIFTTITWITFARFTMGRIEKSMKADGLPEGFLWDGLGGRVFFYAYAIIFTEQGAARIDRLINTKLVRSYANKSDWWRGVFFIVISHIWVALIFIGISVTD